MTKPNEEKGFDSSDCSSSVSDPFYHTDFTTSPTPAIKVDWQGPGFDMDSFIKRCRETVEEADKAGQNA